ncbi:hypothetical protein EV207_11619 [Scopulibacillus darangshiensis]|uniref:DinB family protein n=1 Tax=Scopulibacillus darangshiensis TaxID=442528 RepID=A0A4R2P1X2_9BACL|nr:hypothetical protein [Scopulibacillus darangshiensis]TCP28709.1 hypothetical protein EV207_11619 [Scopulibacillus darangshiensis]
MGYSIQDSIKPILKEAFEGPGAEDGSWFTNTQLDSGIFGTLKAMSADEASISIYGSTIASHADHIRYYLWVINTMIRGNEPDRNWESSWEITRVDETRWHQIQKDLYQEYMILNEKIDSPDLEDKVINILGAIAHSSYHLGALRQMIKTINVE